MAAIITLWYQEKALEFMANQVVIFIPRGSVRDIRGSFMIANIDGKPWLGRT